MRWICADWIKIKFRCTAVRFSFNSETFGSSSRSTLRSFRRSSVMVLFFFSWSFRIVLCSLRALTRQIHLQELALMMVLLIKHSLNCLLKVAFEHTTNTIFNGQLTADVHACVRGILINQLASWPKQIPVL